MKEVSWKVELVNTAGMTDDRLHAYIDSELLKIYYGFRRCYSGDVDTFINNDYTDELEKYGKLSDTSREKIEKFIRKMRKTPHETPIEHVSLTFHVSRMSRACGNQWVRSRVASHGQQSQRYVQFDNIETIVPPTIKVDPYALDAYVSAVETIEQTYLYLVNERNIPAEDARYILPNAAATSIVTTMNLRELLHFFRERCCNRAQWEIRNIANAMLDTCKYLFPCIFENAGAKCMSLRKCPETDTCGEKPFLKLFNNK